MSNAEQNDTLNSKINTDKDSKEDCKKDDLQENNKNSEIKDSELKKTLYSSSIQSSMKEDNYSNINTQDPSSPVQYILSDNTIQSSINTQNEQNSINSINLSISQNQNEDSNMYLNNNQINLVNPMEILNKEFNQININSELNKDFSLYNNNSKNINLLSDKNSANQTPFFIQKKEAFNFQQFNPQQTLNLQNTTLTKKIILSCFSSQNKTLLLQNMINEAPKDIIEKIVNELTGTYPSIIKNKNGNYFCSDLFKICEQRQRIKILKELSKTISDDCNDKFANHPIQFIIEYSSCEEEYNLILYSFYDYNKSLIACLDPNGSFVIRKIINHIPEKYRIRFNLIFIRFITFIIKKKFGVVNAKEFIDYTKNEEIFNQIIDLIIKDFLNIANDQFGNYFVQHILKKWYNTNAVSKIKKEIINNFRILFKDKYGSHISDLFLKIANNTDKKQLISSLNLNIVNNNNNINDDKRIMLQIINSFKQNFCNNVNNNINNNNFNNQNLLYQNNYYNNNNNSNNLINQLPLSLNNFGKRK